MTPSRSASGFAELVDGTTLVIQRWLPGSAERAWRYLTDSDLRRKWLAAGAMELAVGAPFEFIWRNDELSNAADIRPAGFAEEVRIESHVIAVEPPRLLTIAWKDGDVTFNLEEKGNRVLLTVTHRGLNDSGGKLMVAGGWHLHLDIFDAELSASKRPSFWRGWAELQAAYRRRFDD